ncbi:putative membrane protein [Filimonas lacunae]|uniref:Putative membrane protein n=1 Tax=Filimonas lacunae TaxID=477680 RepID=A0A173MRJ8_9BACT|nr:bestrophin family ion channel [Filimonas lacunae]BAV09968.1 membrane protein STY1534 [Filimonas lacunae]SIS81851.1 putative membrane protein [Filimonas lacunae]
MTISPSFRFTRVLQYTWKVDLIILLSCVIAYYADTYIIERFFILPPIIPTVLGPAIAFFVGFNNNQAYDRWWEARKIWGAIVNDSRSWARSILCYVVPKEDDTDAEALKQRMVKRHIAFVYALKTALRPQNDTGYRKYLDEQELALVESHSNMHNAILMLQSRDLEMLSQEGYLDGFRFMEMNQLLVKFSDSMGQAERIKNTVFPTIYIFFTRLFILLFTVMITMVCSQSIGPWSIIMGSIVGSVFHITHYNGQALMDPFSTLTTSISMNQISRTIEINLLEMMGEKEIPQPVRPINGEYVM